MKTGLGKGLGALMGSAANINDFSEKQAVPDMMVDIMLVDTDPNQPRKHFDEEKLNELADSIKVHGVMQPLLVVEKNGRYTIVAGERRYRASRIAGLKKIPVLVKNFTEKEILEVALIENIQREDLNPIEQSAALIELMERSGITQEEAAKRVGKSRSAIANLTRLSSLPKEVKEMVRENKLSGGHARALLPLETPKLICEIAEVVFKNGYSVRQTEAYVKKILEPPVAKEKAEMPPEFKEASSRLSDKFETKVAIMGNEKKGKIVLEYYSKDQLFSLFDKLSEK